MTLAHNQDRLRRWGLLADKSGGYGPNTEAAYTAALDKLETLWPLPASIGGMTVEAFFAGFIGTHEGELSLHPKDNGNWSGGKAGVGTLIGSKYGVTGAALSAYRGEPVTAADMAALTKVEAVTLGVANYYRNPGFDKLPWNRVTASIVDKGWGSGPRQAIKMMQRMIGVTADGAIGPTTVAAYGAWLNAKGEEAAARQWADIRMLFDGSLNQPTFLRGWDNRTRSFLPGTTWWKGWEA